MEERNERNAGKNRTPQKQHAAKINRYFSTNTNREEKKESKIHEGPFYSVPKEKERKSLV
jgi:hypothetical protein